ncbi:MAG: hypothetical protein R6V85_10225 [Polyangia bacterium]
MGSVIGKATISAGPLLSALLLSLGGCTSCDEGNGAAGRVGEMDTSYT